MKKNLILQTSVILIFFLLLLAFFPLKNNHLIDEALSCFLQGNLPAAETLLFKIEKEKQKISVAPYRAFIDLAKGDFQNGHFLFQKALVSNQEEESVGELFCGKALSFYFQHRFLEMPPLLEKARLVVKNSSQPLLLEGLYHYEIGDFEKASSSFSKYLDSCEREDNWLQGVIDLYFPKDWVEIRLAHTLIEQQEYSEAREILEQFIDTRAGDIAPFLGYAYLKEGSTFPFLERKSYLKVALCYLERSDIHFQEKMKLIPSLIDEISYLLQEEEECYFAFSLISLLEKWEVKESLKKVAEKVIEKMESDGNLKSLAFCNTLKDKFEGRMFHSILLDKLLVCGQAHLTDKKRKNPFEMWQKIETVTSVIPPSFIEAMGSYTEKEIASLIQEEKQLKRSLAYIKFWKSLDDHREEKNGFANVLLNYGMLFWRKENEEQKGTHILKIALHLCEESKKQEFFKEIEDFFIALYSQAQNSNLVGRLSLIYDALQDFKIGFKGLVTKEELANHLADAEYFLKVRNYFAAKMHAEWVMKVDPDNEEAIRLIGLSSFHLGNYRGAMNFLKPLYHHDLEVKEAIAICEAYLAEELLVQADLFNLEL